MTSGRRFASVTLDNVDDLPPPCRSCIFWELDPLAEQKAREVGDPDFEKEAWISATLLRWGSCGTLLYQHNTLRGYVLYAPPSFVRRSVTFPTSPVSADSVQLITARVAPEHRGKGLGRALVQTAARDLATRGVRALEAFGDARHEQPNCVLPADFLVAVGFNTVRPHPHWPRLRLDLHSMAILTAEVEAALERIVETIIPAPALRPV